MTAELQTDLERRQVNIKNLPEQLKNAGKFCVWKYEERNGTMTKMPYNPRTGNRAKSNEATTFAPLEVAMKAVQKAQEGYDGIGLGLFNNFCAIDIDNCIEDGQFDTRSEDIIKIMNSYTERSPSGKGIRIIFKTYDFPYSKKEYHERYYINKRDKNDTKKGLEVYVEKITNRYVTITGDTISQGVGVEERRTELLSLLNKYMSKQQSNQQGKPLELFTEDEADHQLISKAHQAQNGTLFGALWNGDISAYGNDDSSADIALCNLLAFWTGRNPERMDRLFRMSKLMRDKWDRPTSGSTYGALTIQKALSKCTSTYNPQEYFMRRADQITVGIGLGKRALSDLHPEKNKRYGWHDIGSGNLFADWHKEIARYVPERRKWFIYNGKVWEPDVENLGVMEMCKTLADNLMIYALSLQDELLRQDYIKYVTKWQRRGYREIILKDAASIYPISAAEFDKNPHTFNCLNGTLDLKTGKIKDHSPADLLTNMAGVRFDPQAASERWIRFVDEIMQGDQATAEFLQKSLGYALTGDTAFECFFILYGPTTRNGKGTCMETFAKLLGDYGKTANPETIGQKWNPDSRAPNSDVARLAGARFVNIAEPDKKLILSSAFVKRLTGRDTITARHLYESDIEFHAQFKIFINTNFLPTVTDNTLFDSGRVKIIPFKRHFKAEERDRNLKDELSRPDNLSGLLNWCLVGLRMIKETGFDAPDSVRSATERYRRDSDKIARFLENEFKQDPLAETRTSEAYGRYKSWCRENGFFPENSANFKSSISKLANVVRRRPRTGEEKTTLIEGYRLIPKYTGFGEEDCEDGARRGRV